MKKIKSKSIEILIEDLEQLKKECSSSLDLKKQWLVSVEEMNAMNKVISMLKDCL